MVPSSRQPLNPRILLIHTLTSNLQNLSYYNQSYTPKIDLLQCPVMSPKSASPQAPMQCIMLKQAQDKTPFPAVQLQGHLPEDGGQKKISTLIQIKSYLMCRRVSSCSTKNHQSQANDGHHNS